ncbi:MAG: DUF3368 domain-containing protein [Terriglobia bacterium]
MIVVADTTPLHYLVLIEESHLLLALYGRVLIPPAVLAELNDPETPGKVKRWIENRPEWLEVRVPERLLADLPATLGPGECEAIALSEELRADALLIDEWDGRQEAARRRLTVVGTLRVLGGAAEKGLVDLSRALTRLRATNFRVSADLIEQVLEQDRRRKQR